MKPVHTIRLGNVSVSVWERTGKRGTFHEVTVQRSYKGKDGKPAYTGSFNARDLDTLKAALDLAAGYLQNPEHAPHADGPAAAVPDPLAEYVNGHAPEGSGLGHACPGNPLTRPPHPMHLSGDTKAVVHPGGIRFPGPAGRLQAVDSSA